MSSQHADRVDVAEDAARAGGERALAGFRGQLDVETKSGPADVVTAVDRAAQAAVVDVIREAFPEEPIVGEEDEAGTTASETDTAVPATGRAWIVDPIDGTANFVRGQRFWTTAVTTVDDGEPVASVVYAPALEDCYVADADGARRNGDPISVSAEDRTEAAAVCPTLTWPGGTGTVPDDESPAGVRDVPIERSLSARFGNWRRFGSAQLELALVADGGLEGALAGVSAAPWDTVAGIHLIRAARGKVTDASGVQWRHDATSLVASNGRLHESIRAVLDQSSSEERTED